MHRTAILHFLCSILQYMNQRYENRGRWVNIMQTTSVPGNNNIITEPLFTLGSVYSASGAEH